LRRIHQWPGLADALRLSALSFLTYQNFCGSLLELIRGRSGKRAQVDYDRLYAYHIFAGLDVTGKPEETGA